MPVSKEKIVDEIKRAAAENGGVALGWRRFASETGIGRHDWYGRFWTRWGDAAAEAGVEPNRMHEAIDERVLLERLVALTKTLRRIPSQGDLMMAARNDSTFPSETAFRRLGPKTERAGRVIAFCGARPENEDVVSVWSVVNSKAESDPSKEPTQGASGVGYVYLLQHGSRREYKIGRTNNPVRREGEIGIQLPEKLLPVHYIETDDPPGIERYWHTRFASKRKEGEWFSLSQEDLRAFKRWKRIY
jgi:Meiotically up-regulated gene 113